MEIRYRTYNQDGDLQEEGTLVGNWREDGRIEFNRPTELHQNQKLLLTWHGGEKSFQSTVKEPTIINGLWGVQKPK